MGPDPVPQAGAVVFRTDGAGLRILLVRARRNPSDWIFPKGHVERGETAAEAAVREAAEEAGVSGRVVAALPPAVTFEQNGRRVRVDYFLVEFRGDVDASEEREQVWLPPPDASLRLTHESARAVLQRGLIVLRAG